MAISKRIRFEVFKRDGFKCQYCGRSAPDVILHVDHIEPVSKGGEDDLLNLITSCLECNLGKADKRLTDQSAIEKQRRQLDELNERREQLEMMIEWANSLREMKADVATRLGEHWTQVVLGGGWTLNERGLARIVKLLRKYSPDKIMEAMDEAGEKYLRREEGGNLSQESQCLAWDKVSVLLAVADMPEDVRKLSYIRGIVRNRMAYCDNQYCMGLLRQAYELGVSIDELKQIALDCHNWTRWRMHMEEVIAERSGDA